MGGIRHTAAVLSCRRSCMGLERVHAPKHRQTRSGRVEELLSHVDSFKRNVLSFFGPAVLKSVFDLQQSFLKGLKREGMDKEDR